MQSSPESDVVSIPGGDLAVLERQRAIFQRLYQHHPIHAAGGIPFPGMLDDVNLASQWNTDDNSRREAARALSRTNSSVTAAPTLNPRKATPAGRSTRKRKAERCSVEKKWEGESWEAQSSEITMKSEREIPKQSKKALANNDLVQKANSSNYIHVRARRGQATDSHSLAERARREKISKKMKCLQDLVPGCSKVVGKAGMLDEIINYVQSLQKQVEFLSMKLASMNPRQLDYGIDNFFPKDVATYMGEEEVNNTNTAAADFLPLETGGTSRGGSSTVSESEDCRSSDVEIMMMAQQRKVNNISASLSSIPPDFYLDSSYFTQLSMQGWESEWPISAPFNASFH